MRFLAAILLTELQSDGWGNVWAILRVSPPVPPPALSARGSGYTVGDVLTIA